MAIKLADVKSIEGDEEKGGRGRGGENTAPRVCYLLDFMRPEYARDSALAGAPALARDVTEILSRAGALRNCSFVCSHTYRDSSSTDTRVGGHSNARQSPRGSASSLLLLSVARPLLPCLPPPLPPLVPSV